MLKLDQAIGAILLILALIFALLWLTSCATTPAPDATEGHEPYSDDFRWVYEL